MVPDRTETERQAAELEDRIYAYLRSKHAERALRKTLLRNGALDCTRLRVLAVAAYCHLAAGQCWINIPDLGVVAATDPASVYQRLHARQPEVPPSGRGGRASHP